ncbi:exodeoxyribonuclease VII small subunit [Alteromonas pelagimontana]|uniref:exodeoxyribonuclease VII small subunit n=1 Tax=Alteromonas pelagimontana TaxID=1858656 RepID=UPI00094F588F|nr:exodeoxyribonuclease VII small subunit [Alteromonas pelagimontana]
MTEKTTAPAFEDSLTELEAIVSEMESGDLPLNVALEKFERGIKLSRLSQQALEQAEQKVKILLNEQDENKLRDFNSTAEE